MDNRLKGIIYMLISSLGFTLMGVIIKYIPEIPLFEKILFRNLISLIISGIIILATRTSFRVEREYIPFLAIRCSLGHIGVFLNFYSITYLILADSNMLNKLSPISVAIFAYFFLKEKIDKWQWIGIAVTLVGALFVIKPSFSLKMIPSLAGLLSVSFGGASYTIIRYLKNKVDSNLIVFYFSLFSVIASIPFVVKDYVVPNLYQLTLLLGIGLTASVAQFFLTYSYKYGKASEVAVYNYVGIIYGIILGFTLFGEIPDRYSIIGGIIILTTSLLLYLHNKRKIE